MPGWFTEHLEAARGLLLVLILAPLAFAVSPMSFRWDDTFFIHHAVCVERAFWTANLSQFDGCLASMAKSPILALLMIPAGPVRGNLESIVVAPFVLALFIAALVWLLARLTAIARVPLPAAIVAAIAAIASPPIWNNGAPFLADGLLAVIVVNTVIMLFVEWEAPTATTGQTIGRAGLWALLLTLGLFCKVTFGFVAVLLAPAALAVSWVRNGFLATAIKFVALLVFLIPAMFVLDRYGELYLQHAQDSSFGALAVEFYNDGLSRFQFLSRTLPTVWPMLVGIAGLSCWAFFARAERGRIALALWGGAVMLGYVVLATGSPTKDTRYFWMVWLTLPFCAAAAVAPSPAFPAPAPSAKVLVVLLIFALATPTLGRVRLDGLRLSVETMARLPANRPASVALTTDDPEFNVETMLLAQQLDWSHRSKLIVFTVVYNIVNDRTPEKSLETLAKTDIVLSRYPAAPGAPEWTNRFAPAFDEALRTSGRQVEVQPGSPPIDIFTLQPTEAK